MIAHEKPRLSHQPTPPEIIQLAAAEGHDADIASNEGFISSDDASPSRSPSGQQSPQRTHIHHHDQANLDFPKEIDVEKAFSSRRASSSSGTSLREPGQPPPATPIDLEKAPSRTSAPDEAEGEEEDPNVVFWDGPDDPLNPMNWPNGRKWGAIAVVSALTFFTPLGSSIFAPGVPAVMKEFHSDNELLTGFVVSVYVLGFAAGPLIIVSFAFLPCGRFWLGLSFRYLFL
jgi:hypothetical protein